MTNCINEDMDSLLDVLADLISETPKKKPTTPPQSSAEDVIKRLKVVTPSGRVDTADPSCCNTGERGKTDLLQIQIDIDNSLPHATVPACMPYAFCCTRRNY